MIDPKVKQTVENILGPSKMKVGDIVDHPDGRKVLIIAGQYWGRNGISNFWYWREVKKDGSLGKQEHGYGW